jgi:NADPH-dependent curcumin reductase CurA
MKQILQQLLTGKDNQTYDLGRVSWLVGMLAVIGLAAYEVMHSTVSLRELAESLGIVSAASGASVAMKQGAEPQ